jgi:uncharacterized membrane protein YqjE
MYSQKEMKQTRNQPGAPDSFAELLGELADKSAILVREEVSLARQEVKESIRDLKSPVIMLALGAFGATFAVLSLLTALILALSLYWQPWQAALGVGVILAIAASIVIAMGIQQMKQARIKPEQTLETLEENKEWLKEII